MDEDLSVAIDNHKTLWLTEIRASPLKSKLSMILEEMVAYLSF